MSLQLETETKITPSCGCVFCDLNLPTTSVAGTPHHELRTSRGHKTVFIECGFLTRPSKAEQKR